MRQTDGATIYYTLNQTSFESTSTRSPALVQERRQSPAHPGRRRRKNGCIVVCWSVIAIMDKEYAIPERELKSLVPPMGYCIATDRITVDSQPVGYMYREAPDSDQDSGWRFFAGDESQEYVDDAANMMMCEVNAIANYDPSIIPFLDAEPPCEFERMDPDSDLQPIENEE